MKPWSFSVRVNHPSEWWD